MATRKELFARIAETMADDAEVVEMCNKYIEQLSKKYSKPNTDAEEFARAVAAFMVKHSIPMTNKELATAMGVSTQKMSAALRRLIDQGVVNRYADNDKKTADIFDIVA